MLVWQMNYERELYEWRCIGVYMIDWKESPLLSFVFLNEELYIYKIECVERLLCKAGHHW